MFPDYFRDDVFRLETQRLWLRWPTAADAPAIERLAGEREVSEFTARVPHPYPKGGGEAFAYGVRKANADGEGLTLALAWKQRPGQFIGVVGLEGAGETVEIGYWLGQPYWGSGLMSEAVEALLDMVWLATDIDRIEARVALLNGRSRRVLERAGFAACGERLIEAPARGGALAAMGFELPRPRARFGAAIAPRAALSACCAGL
ncbi:MAG: GNAT family N-acetyltransferase [Hyphomicrobiales bacterium]|nr:GNAT family N-acetyltransferase [Hyphomicrobiales bacterium]